jgi:molybdate transport system permease protein
MIAAGALLAFLAIPIVALALATGPRALAAGLASEAARAALRLSLATTVASTALVVALGLPLAWWIARGSGRGRRAAEALVGLPAVVPPAVAGLALLLAFGRRGLLGPALARVGIAPAFDTAAVVLAQIFVATPFFVQAAIAAFARLDGGLLVVARSLGAGPARVFFRIALPLAAPGLVAGAAMAWARALGEFGATLMFAGNLPGRTQTLPLAIYTALESDAATAQALAVALVVVGFGVLLLLRALSRR